MPRGPKVSACLEKEGRNFQEEKTEEEEEEAELDAPVVDGDGGLGVAAGVALASGGSSALCWFRTNPDVSLVCLGENKIGCSVVSC